MENAPAKSEAHRLLEKHFGFREFLEGQESAIGAILAGDDTLIVMPTGGGKSLCYQLPAMILDGITIVVSPLIALMKDQVDALAEKKIPATFINSSLNDAEINNRISAMARGEFRIVYVAPERFKSTRFIETLEPLSIALFAIDEAHCISQWGHDFRPDYLRLKWVLKALGQPAVAALTATATPEVRKDIIEQLGLGTFGRKAPNVFVSGFARQNLTMAVTHVKNKDGKLSRILRAIRDYRTGIVYCATRKNVERVAKDLAAEGVQFATYHGGMTEKQRTKEQDDFMSGKKPVVVATNAFGMGVDRSDLRFIVHFDIPGSVEAYYQEAGRAGRDGEPAYCEMLFNYADIRTQKFFIEGANPTRDIIADLYRALLRICAKGPVDMSISSIAEEVESAKNEMAVGSGLYLLERAGFILREYASGARSYTTSICQPVRKFGDLEIDFERLDKKFQRDMAKLDQMVAYADYRGCRHRFILEYFGDPEAGQGCNVCDNCLRGGHITTRLPDETEIIRIQKALSCVARLNGRFGRGRVMQTLVGSRSKEIIDAGLDRLSTYGLLAEEGTDYVWSLLDALIKAGCIAVDTGKYPTLSLTPLGLEVVHRRQVIPMALPALTARKEKPKREGRAKAEKDIETGGPCNDSVLEALKQWRRRKCAIMGGVPAYIVFPDATLREIARTMPKTADELMTIKGIGPAKARRFGRETLDIVNGAARQN